MNSRASVKNALYFVACSYCLMMVMSKQDKTDRALLSVEPEPESDKEYRAEQVTFQVAAFNGAVAVHGQYHKTLALISSAFLGGTLLSLNALPKPYEGIGFMATGCLLFIIALLSSLISQAFSLEALQRNVEGIPLDKSGEFADKIIDSCTFISLCSIPSGMVLIAAHMLTNYNYYLGLHP